MNVGGRPQANGMLVGDEFRSQTTTGTMVGGLEMNRPAPVQLVVTVHRPSAAESDEHGFGSTGYAEHLVAKDQFICLVKRRKRPLAFHDRFTDQGFANTVGCPSNLRSFWHGYNTGVLAMKECLQAFFSRMKTK